MSKSAILSSSIAKKYWMALTGLFLCLFLVGHLLGNLQLLGAPGEETKRAFNEYAYFMGHNIFIKVLSYLTYISILFHAIDGIMLTVQNKKARPQGYAYNRPNANSSWTSRYMAVLGTLILVFIVLHMSHFWYKMKVTGDIPLHKKELVLPANPMMGGAEQKMGLYLTTTGNYVPVDQVDVKNKTDLYAKGVDLKMGEGYKDLYTVVMNFFGKSNPGEPVNDMAMVAVIIYVLSMFVLMFHLWHGFKSAFQSLGINHRRYNKIIEVVGKSFAVIVPLAFAIIPVMIFLS